MEPPLLQPRKKSKGLALTLLIAPSLLIILPFLVYLATQPNTAPVINIAIFLLVPIGFLAWLPGLIIGIILLAKK